MQTEDWSLRSQHPQCVEGAGTQISSQAGSWLPCNSNYRHKKAIHQYRATQEPWPDTWNNAREACQDWESTSTPHSTEYTQCFPRKSSNLNSANSEKVLKLKSENLSSHLTWENHWKTQVGETRPHGASSFENYYRWRKLHVAKLCRLQRCKWTPSTSPL